MTVHLSNDLVYGDDLSDIRCVCAVQAEVVFRKPLSEVYVFQMTEIPSTNTGIF